MSDFRREYQMSGADLAAISKPEFQILLQGLSGQSRFAQALADRPQTLYDPADREAVRAAALR